MTDLPPLSLSLPKTLSLKLSNSSSLICFNQVTGPSDNTSAPLLCCSAQPQLSLWYTHGVLFMFAWKYVRLSVSPQRIRSENAEKELWSFVARRRRECQRCLMEASKVQTVLFFLSSNKTVYLLVSSFTLSTKIQPVLDNKGVNFDDCSIKGDLFCWPPFKPFNYPLKCQKHL